MAGRQKHVKKVYSERSEQSYLNKLTGIYSIVSGEESAREWVKTMLGNWKKVFVNIYHKVHSNPAIQDYMNRTIGKAFRFVGYQIINELVYAVLLTHSETGTVVYDKYERQGVPRDIILDLMVLTTQAMMEIDPSISEAITRLTGAMGLTRANVISILDQYVLSTPPLPSSISSAPKLESGVAVPEIYAGTTSFSSTQPAVSSIDEIKRILGM